MNGILKRVAKAICCPSGSCENDGRAYDPIKGSISICQAGSFEREARGAIAAMREPTEAMLDAGDSTMPQIRADQDITTGYDALKEAWPAMIDAAVSPAHRNTAAE